MTGIGEAIAFWILAPVAVLAALGMLAAKKAVHSALLLALTMICLAVFYLAQDAPFLGVVQVVVYTGAVMMLFLFVLMLVGVDSSDSLVETLRGQRVAAVLAALGFAGLLVLGIGSATVDGFGSGGAGATGAAGATGLERANADGNVQGLARLLFVNYVFAFEVTSALLITAAMGAMVLTHRERQELRPSQRELSKARFANMRVGRHPGPLPTPGVYARHNAVDTPALLPDGTPSDLSVPKVVSARGDARPSAMRAGVDSVRDAGNGEVARR